ncbi:EFR1 family ferrodoxin [Cellulosilyticum sp. I15G10I2]|uniref:EFR1 family ferrodoxin n=1 Tax=Cellulosilyticum sp. I15G10I2 TaxID=1892843 RepID=UPI00085CADF6|nr:EFR1 family ferrodoxin [Cellulosilyticum sp. I15G10I2]
MKKIVIYYFSGTGNTWWLAKALQEKLSQHKHQVACHSIETLTAKEGIDLPGDFDHIIFGFPVYGSTAPKLMLDFMHHFPDAAHSQTVSVFGTHALASGDTAYHISKLLAKKGYLIKQTMHFTMMTNLHIPRFRFLPPRNDYRVSKLHQKTLPKVEKLAHAITFDKNIIVGKNLPGFLLGYLQRSHVDKLIATASRDFEVDMSRCTRCNKCQRICPVHNIVKTDSSYTFKNNCILCMRCYSQCPKCAILIGKASSDEIKYPRYRGPEPSFDAQILTNHISS